MWHHPLLVTAPATSPVDLPSVKAWLRVDYGDEDETIQSMINSAVSYLDGHRGILGRCIINQVWSTAHRSWSKRFAAPMPDVSAVVVKYYDINGAQQTVSASNYRVYADYIYLKDSFDSPQLEVDRDDPITIEWTCGFGAASTNVPQDLRDAIKTLVAHWFENREAIVPNERRVELERMPLSFTDIVAKYRTGFAV